MVKRVALDTNLALLLAVGAANQTYVARHKRLGAYEPADYTLLIELLNRSAGILFCPNVVSETSNLIRYSSEPIRSKVAGVFAEMVRKSEERYVRSAVAVDDASYKSLGVTDAVLLLLTGLDAVLVTVDLDLYLAAQRTGLDVIKFTHLREARF